MPNIKHSIIICRGLIIARSKSRAAVLRTLESTGEELLHSDIVVKDTAKYRDLYQVFSK